MRTPDGNKKRSPGALKTERRTVRSVILILILQYAADGGVDLSVIIT